MGYSGYGKRNKYGARKVVRDGMVFDSIAEANRWQELKLLQRAGEIAGLDRQVKYEIIPEHREPDRIGPKGGVKRGKVIEPARYYVADFVYYEAETAQLVVEDVKGYKTPEYRLKKALMYDRYGIRVRET